MNEHELIQMEATKALAKDIVIAMEEKDETKRAEMFTAAFAKMGMSQTEQSKAQIKDELSVEMKAIHDSMVMSERGNRQYTSAELKWAEAMLENMKTRDPQMSISGVDNAFPETIINNALQDIQKAHPLLEVINLRDTSAITKFIITKDVDALAEWVGLTEPVAKELSATIDTIDVTLCKLCAKLPISIDYIDVSPSWLLDLIMMILVEALAGGLENAVINGTGIKQPIGMRKDMSAAITPGSAYPDKTPVVLETLLATDYNAAVAMLMEKPDGTIREVSEVTLICNPIDYVLKVGPASQMLNALGTYVNNIFPFPTRVIQSRFIEKGRAIMCLPQKYFLGVGIGKSGRIEYSDHEKFSDDIRMYKCRALANGMPEDNAVSVLLDITDLKVTGMPVTEVGMVVVPTAPQVQNILIGALTLSPAFSADVLNYTAATTNATNNVNVIADLGVDLEITVNGTVQTNNTAASWNTGANTVEIEATALGVVTIYTVTVTRS